MAVVHLFCKVTPLADAEAITTAVQKAQAEGDQVVTKAGAFVRDGDRVNAVLAGTQ